jgi:hypothetical protein
MTTSVKSALSTEGTVCTHCGRRRTVNRGGVCVKCLGSPFHVPSVADARRSERAMRPSKAFAPRDYAKMSRVNLKYTDDLVLKMYARHQELKAAKAASTHMITIRIQVASEFGIKWSAIPYLVTRAAKILASKSQTQSSEE